MGSSDPVEETILGMTTIGIHQVAITSLGAEVAADEAMRQSIEPNVY